MESQYVRTKVRVNEGRADKICPRCGSPESVPYFVKYGNYTCKKCWNEYHKALNRSNRAKVAADARKYRAAHPEKVREARRKRYAKPENAIKNKARNALSWAITSGRLVRMPCEVCGASKAEGHHEDYGKPLDVKWLCRTCHVDLHNRKNGLTSSIQ